MQSITKRQGRTVALIIALMMLATCFSFMQATAYGAENGKKAPYKEGDDISKAAFYIAVDADDDGKLDDVYYYTEAEIKDYNETHDFQYNNHGQIQTDSGKGAKLSSLIADLGGEAKVEDQDTVIYMEFDAYHANPSMTNYRDIVEGLEKPTADRPIPTQAMIIWAAKTTYSQPDQYYVNDDDYLEFKTYPREASAFRGARQVESANDAVLKQLMGVIITGAPELYGKGTATQGGITLEHKNAEGEKIAPDQAILGLVEGMKWPVAPTYLEWAETADSPSIITAKPASEGDKLSYTYKENDFLKLNIGGKKTVISRIDIQKIDGTKDKRGNYIGTEIPGNKDGETTYTYYGYNKPKYLRYTGTSLKNILESEQVGGIPQGQRVIVTEQNGKSIDITDSIDDYFVAYYYSESKSAWNIANEKRRPLNYDCAVLVNMKSAPVEYSNAGDDYTALSGEEPLLYKNPTITITENTVAAPAKVTAALTAYNKATVTWSKVEDATGYTVSYKKASASKWSAKKVTGTSLTIGNLAGDTKYQFRVTANKLTVSSKASSAVSVTTLKAPAVKVKKSGASAVKVSYTNLKGEKGYQIARSTKAGKGFKTIKTQSANKISYTDKSVKKNKTYYYKVRAYQKSGQNTIYGPWSKAVKIKR